MALKIVSVHDVFAATGPPDVNTTSAWSVADPDSLAVKIDVPQKDSEFKVDISGAEVLKLNPGIVAVIVSQSVIGKFAWKLNDTLYAVLLNTSSYP